MTSEPTMGGPGMSWYLQSLDDFDAHHGPLIRDRVHAACGVVFRPEGHCGKRESSEFEPAQLCPECVAAAAAPGDRPVPRGEPS